MHALWSCIICGQSPWNHSLAKAEAETIDLNFKKEKYRYNEYIDGNWTW
jgi:hypothetical protein